MSCWVAPVVAAELWGCSEQAVLDAIAGGRVPMREENGWTFVDVAPDSPQITPCLSREPSPPTFTQVTQDEIAALMEVPEQPRSNTEPAADELGPLCEEESTSRMSGDWHSIRRSVSRTRKPPRSAAA